MSAVPACAATGVYNRAARRPRGTEMRIVACITQRAVIDRILDHLRRARDAPRNTTRGPPHSTCRASRRPGPQPA